MKYRNNSTTNHKEHFKHSNRALVVDGDAIIVSENEILNLPQQCIHCCSDKTLHQREQELMARHQYTDKAKALITYYLCKNHAKNAEKNGFLIAGWLALSFLLIRSIPPGIAVVAFIAMGIGVFFILSRTMLGLKVKNTRQGNYGLLGVLSNFSMT